MDSDGRMMISNDEWICGLLSLTTILFSSERNQDCELFICWPESIRSLLFHVSRKSRKGKEVQ